MLFIQCTKEIGYCYFFLPVLDYGDVVYQFAPSYLLSSLDAVYHGALRFISDCKSSTHHCLLYNRVGWSSLLIRRKMHWYLIIYKAILGMLPSYLCCLIKQKIVEKYFLRSQNCYTLSVPFVRSELGKKAFMYAAPTDWNLLQSKLKLQICCLWIILKQLFDKWKLTQQYVTVFKCL